MSGPLNYSTKIAAAKTVGEVHGLLAEAGASAIGTTYAGGKPSGVNFVLDGESYVLPTDVAGMARAMKAAWDAGQIRSIGKTVALSGDQAERVAWRVVKDWLEAQLAMVRASQARPDQIMLPYLVARPDGTTLYALWRQDKDQAAIEGPRA